MIESVSQAVGLRISYHICLLTLVFLDTVWFALVDISDLFLLSSLQNEFLCIIVDSSLSGGDLCPVLMNYLFQK